MYEVLDLAMVTGGTTLSDLSTQDKRELSEENVYFKFKSSKELVEFVDGLASEVEDEEIKSLNKAFDYLYVMGYLVQ